MTTRTSLPAAVAGALLLAACGSSGAANAGGGRGGTAGGATTPGSAAAVSVHSTGKGEVLADARGRTLYVSDQEKGTVRCTSSACTAVWMPLMTSGTAAPAAPAGVAGTLGTIARPGGRQVTLDGRPLYTFAFDHGAGQTAGDGQRDAFGGVHFTWHAATASGAAPSSAPPSSSTGYNY